MERAFHASLEGGENAWQTTKSAPIAADRSTVLVSIAISATTISAYHRATTLADTAVVPVSIPRQVVLVLLAAAPARPKPYARTWRTPLYPLPFLKSLRRRRRATFVVLALACLGDIFMLKFAYQATLRSLTQIHKTTPKLRHLHLSKSILGVFL